MEDKEKQTDADNEKPEEIIDEIVKDLDDVHRTLTDETARVGYARDALRSVRPVWKELSNTSTCSPEVASIYTSGLNVLSAIRDEVRSQRVAISPLAGLFQPSSGSINVFVSATGTTAGFASISVESVPPNLTSPVSPNRYGVYADRFSKFDLSLGQTYRAIWEALYVTRADPERGALYLIRQAFDHLFDKLASDEEVRKSAYWTPKEAGKESQIWREERIKFAATKHVKDKAKAETLIASAKHMIDVYQGLNRAHKPGEINQVLARQALGEMQSILEDWADAIGI